MGYLGSKEFGINTSCVRGSVVFYMMCSHNRFSLRFSSSFFFIVRYPHRTDDDLFHGSETLQLGHTHSKVSLTFIFSRKATKIDEIFTIDLTLRHCYVVSVPK